MANEGYFDFSSMTPVVTGTIQFGRQVIAQSRTCWTIFAPHMRPSRQVEKPENYSS